MITDFVKKYSPPGIKLGVEKNFLLIGLFLALFYSSEFVADFISARNELFYYVGKNRILDTSAVMPSFRIVLGNSLIGFIILGISMLGFIAYHYFYFRQGSKSIYLMKRLSDKKELYFRVLTLPVIAFLFCLTVAFIVLLIYFTVYLIFTPKPCLSEGQWQMLWRF